MRRRARVVAVVVALVVGATGAALAGVASRAPRLPPVPADRLVASMLAALAADPSFSGEISVRVDLGIGDLGALSDLGSTSPLALLAGDHVVRVWRSPFGARVSIPEGASELSWFAGRTGVWTWDFSTLTATRLAPPGVPTGLPFPLGALAAPPDFRALLGVLRPSTRVVVRGATTVAGRPCYVLSIEPRTSRTLVRRVEIDVDAARRLPLALRIVSRRTGSTAVTVAFSSVSFARPDPRMFDFAPPPGSRVRRGSRTGAVGSLGGLGRGLLGAAGLPLPGTSGGPGAAAVRTFGSGWASAVAVRLARPIGERDGGGLARVLPLSGPLISIAEVRRPSGAWLLVGAVPQSVLRQDAARL